MTLGGCILAQRCAKERKADLIGYASICARSRDGGAPLLQVDCLLLNTRPGARSALGSKLPGRSWVRAAARWEDEGRLGNMGSRISWARISLLGPCWWFGETDLRTSRLQWCSSQMGLSQPSVLRACFTSAPSPKAPRTSQVGNLRFWGKKVVAFLRLFI